MNAVYVRAPLRISLGGGTDLPSYYSRDAGFVVSAAIDRYLHVRVASAAGTRHRLSHLELEEVDEAADIEHPILREAIGARWRGGPIEIELIGRTVGKQDGYAAAYGGLRAYEFASDGSVATRESAAALEAGALDRCAELMAAQWELKRARSGSRDGPGQRSRTRRGSSSPATG